MHSLDGGNDKDGNNRASGRGGVGNWLHDSTGRPHQAWDCKISQPGPLGRGGQERRGDQVVDGA